MEVEELRKLIANGESLTLEFKGEERGAISDREIYEAIVCLANVDGGTLLIGVENDGRITGARPRHGTTTDSGKLQAAIFNNTEPRINARVSVIPAGEGDVIAIVVDRYPEICATKAGVSLRRVMGVQGPECVPFYPHEHVGRRVTLGLLDFTAQSCPEARFEDFDPLEFERLRQAIKRLHGDPALPGLADADLAKALQLVDTNQEALVPNIAGLLLLGRKESLRRFIPTHEAAFQVLDLHGDVRVNDFFHAPLVTTIEEIQTRFDARIEEEEVMIGMFRLPVPEYGRMAFREALLNALFHRDYSQMGTVFVQWHHDHMLITNPGGLPDGITLQNILVHEPKPRNARLYESAKRIGLVEKTGRGVDKIFHDQLRLGRPAPDFGRSDASGVRVVLQGGKANLEFARFIYEQDKSGHEMRLDELLVLNKMFYERRIDGETAGRLIQKSQSDGRSVLERLHERGFVEGRGEKKGRAYCLSATLYKSFHMKAEYVRAKGFEPIQHEQMVLDYVHKHGRITRSEAADLCRLSGFQASRLLGKIAGKYPQFRLVGTRRGAHYIWHNEQK
jgi:ATP-dependent DNA helicase RecG